MNDTQDEVLLGHWQELKTLVETVEADVAKSSRGVKAAGVRARRGLRTLKTKAAEIVKYTVNRDKEDSKEAAAPPVKKAKKKN